MRNTKSKALMAGVMIAGAVSLSACATKKYVNESLAPVAAKADEHGTRLGAVEGTARDALDRATAAGKLAEGKFVYSVVMSDDTLKFGNGKAKLTPEGEAALTAFAERLKGENKNVYVEVQGHTDAGGPPEMNLALGAKRADAVRNFLNRQGVALNRMSTISYGEEAPVAPNNTRAGRAENRRVVLVVLS